MTAPTRTRPMTRAHRRTGQVRLRRAAVLLAVAMTALTTSVFGLVAPSSADTGTAGGWVRLTHLSPDTPAVNVALTNLSDSSAVIKLSNVGYGDVSSYQKVGAGRYVATMTPPGGGADATPAVSQAITVRDGKAYTIAAVGRNADLRGAVFDDDLTTPDKGMARIRLVQASVSADSLTVRAVGGPVLAENLAFGTTTDYVSVPEGVWTLDISSAGGPGSDATITARSGTVNTVVLLDQDGRPTATVIKDAAAAPSRPARGTGVETGGGGTATDVVSAELTAAGTTGQGASPLGRAASVTILGALAAAIVLTGRRGFRTRLLQPTQAAAARSRR